MQQKGEEPQAGSRALLRGALVLLGAAGLGLAAARLCQTSRARPALPEERALPPGDDGPLDRMIASAEALHPGESAFRLVSEGPEFFADLVRSAEQAVRSLDVQTYIWRADDTGMFLAHTLLGAADRGVRVRLLLDDMDARENNDGLAALAAHPNIRMRVFNPFHTRRGLLGMVCEGLMNFRRLNRRMHNKTWIADNRIAFAGGRNIGDDYFGASSETNFIDLDFAMIGPVVRDVSACFDRYWNSSPVYPIESLSRIGADQLDELRSALEARAREVAASRYAEALRLGNAVSRLTSGDWPMEWTRHYAFIADDPLKARTKRSAAAECRHVGAAVLEAIERPLRELTVASPYFVPGRELTDRLVEMTRAGVSVRVLTNSLAANDVAAVHGGYSRYRKPLLAGGVRLWELKAADSAGGSGPFGSSGASLHTKALVVDGRRIIVGSYNLDPRSTWLNCEQGVFVESANLAAQLDDIFAVQFSGGKSWLVKLDGDALNWSDGEECFNTDPRASIARRFEAWLVRTLRLEAQL